MPDSPDGTADLLGAELARIEAASEEHIRRLALTEFTVAQEPSGDLRRALAALREVLALADGAQVEFTNVNGDPLYWDLDPADIRHVIARALLGEDAGDA